MIKKSASVLALIVALGVSAYPVLAEQEVKNNAMEVNQDFELTEEQKEALILVSEIDKLLKINKVKDEREKTKKYKSSIKAVDDSNTAKLRSANFIEGILDKNEGLTLSEISTVYNLGVTATQTASNKYPNDSQIRDAYRHFIWNFNAANSLTQSKAQIATNNHEWGLILINPAIEHYSNRYLFYLNSGLNSLGAANAAMADTTNYLPALKSQKMAICDQSVSKLKTVATKGNIMDWNNNYWGRNFYKTYSSADNAFNAAKTANKLILDELKVSDTNYNTVWTNKYYK